MVTRNRFAGLEERAADEEEEVREIGEVQTGGEGTWTKLRPMTLNLAGICKPLVSAAEVVAKGIPLFIAALKSPKPFVRHEAADSLAELGPLAKSAQR